MKTITDTTLQQVAGRLFAYGTNFPQFLQEINDNYTPRVSQINAFNALAYKVLHPEPFENFQLATGVVQPTGSGKTLVQAFTARAFVEAGYNVIVVTSLKNLTIQHTGGDFKNVFDNMGCKISYWSSERSKTLDRSLDRQVVITTYSSIKTKGFTEKYFSFHTRENTVLLMDEAHNAVTKKTHTAITLLSDSVIWWTATDKFLYSSKPGRKKGMVNDWPTYRIGQVELWKTRGVEDLYGKPCISTSTFDSMRQQELVDEVTWYGLKPNFDLSGVKIKPNDKGDIDYDQKDLIRLLNRHWQDICRLVSEKYQHPKLFGSKALIFTPASLDLARWLTISLAQNLKHKGVEVRYVGTGPNGITPRENRENIAWFKEPGKNKILIAVDMMREGEDIPDLETLFWLRPTPSFILTKQSIGRVLRRCDSIQRVNLVDFVLACPEMQPISGAQALGVNYVAEAHPIIQHGKIIEIATLAKGYLDLLTYQKESNLPKHDGVQWLNRDEVYEKLSKTIAINKQNFLKPLQNFAEAASKDVDTKYILYRGEFIGFGNISEIYSQEIILDFIDYWKQNFPGYGYLFNKKQAVKLLRERGITLANDDLRNLERVIDYLVTHGIHKENELIRKEGSFIKIHGLKQVFTRLSLNIFMHMKQAYTIGNGYVFDLRKVAKIIHKEFGISEPKLRDILPLFEAKTEIPKSLLIIDCKTQFVYGQNTKTKQAYTQLYIEELKIFCKNNILGLGELYSVPQAAEYIKNNEINGINRKNILRCLQEFNPDSSDIISPDKLIIKTRTSFAIRKKLLDKFIQSKQ